MPKNTLRRFFAGNIMEYFDASEELYNSIQEYRDEHNGEPPNSLRVSPTLYQWIEQIQREERLLKGEELDAASYNVFPTEFGALPIIIDELLSDYEIIPE